MYELCSLEVAPATLSLNVVLNSVILNLPDPTSHNIPCLPLPPGGQGLHLITLMWRCDVMATSCCPRRLSTCRTIAVTIIVSRLSGSLLPAAATCRRTMNNTWECERKHFEGRLKGHQLPSIQPRTRSLSCQCSATK